MTPRKRQRRMARQCGEWVGSDHREERIETMIKHGIEINRSAGPRNRTTLTQSPGLSRCVSWPLSRIVAI
jgi:hypothetical protein